MRSVADTFRQEAVERVARLTAEERIALALRLGDEDVALCCAAHRVSEPVARERFARARATGRLPSRSNDR